MAATVTSTSVTELARAAKSAARRLAQVDPATKNRALHAIADALEARTPEILEANTRDLEAGRENGLSAALLDRLALTEARIRGIADGARAIAALPDPVGEVVDGGRLENGLEFRKVRVPLGVIAVVYEARPNVTIDAAALCLKSGNATILRGGSEALECNTALAKLIGEGLQAAGLPQDAVQVVETADRAAVGKLITMTEFVDVIVPRGGKSLIARLMEESRVPMIKHLDGICHVYVDDRADLAKAAAICDNAKTHRYGTCNTMETLLVARGIASEALPLLARAFQAKDVELRVDAASRAVLEAAHIGSLVDATEADWSTEYLAPVLAVKIVGDMDDAIEHINAYGSHHTDAIVTEDHDRAMRFLREVDSASVMVNASTRFADGFEFGLGAEIGISNDKLHARGPVGLEGLTSLKYVVLGHGEVRQ